MRINHSFIIYIFLSLFIGILPSAKAKGSGSGLITNIEAGNHIGFVWAHHPDLDNLYQGSFPIFQLALSRQSDGSKPWHHTYNFPETGITFIYSNLGYPQVLGHAYGIMPHINLPLYRTENFTLQLRYGAGAAWITNYFRDPENDINQAISTPLNITMNTSVQASVPLGKRISLRGGIGITHFSNGKSSTPNKGLNIPSAKIELVGHLSDISTLPVRLNNPEVFDPWYMVLYVAGGYTALYPPGGARYAEFTFSKTFSRRLSPKSALGLGTDVFFGFSDKAELQRDDTPVSSLTGLLKPGLHLSYELIFTNTAFIVQQGVYLYAANDNDGPIYNRIGFRHRVSSRWILNLTLKSHLFRADYLEWGAGYVIF